MDKKINLCVEPKEFFKERITETMERQGFTTLKIAEFYIVDLLARYMVSANLFDETSEKHVKEDPLAILLLKAQSAGIDLSEKVKILKKLGDTSLYISGFFGDSLTRKVIDLDYYREMGSIAYRSLSGTIRDDSFQELYHELYEKFAGFVDVLTEISHETFVQNNQTLLHLYELYQRTGSEFAKKQLEEKGLSIHSVPLAPSERKQKN